MSTEFDQDPRYIAYRKNLDNAVKEYTLFFAGVFEIPAAVVVCSLFLLASVTDTFEYNQVFLYAIILISVPVAAGSWAANWARNDPGIKKDAVKKTASFLELNEAEVNYVVLHHEGPR